MVKRLSGRSGAFGDGNASAALRSRCISSWEYTQGRLCSRRTGWNISILIGKIVAAGSSRCIAFDISCPTLFASHRRFGERSLSPHFDKLIQWLAGQFGTALQEAIEAQQHTFVDVVAIAERAHQLHVLCHHLSEEASKPRHRT